jgi:23S rRNA pseudouridine1911/1915/1917 synthase
VKAIAKKDGPILELLLEMFESASKTRIRKMLKYQMVQVSGKPVTRADFTVKAGEVVEYLKKSSRGNDIKAPVPIVFEDDHVLITEKPAGLLTYGEKGSGGTSLYRILRDFIHERANSRRRLYVVHRLDREVSGIVMFASMKRYNSKSRRTGRQPKSYTMPWLRAGRRRIGELCEAG